MDKRFLRTTTVAVLAAFAAACGSSTPAPAPTTTVSQRTHIDGWNAIANILEMLGISEGAPPLEEFLAPPSPTADSDFTFYANAIWWLTGSLASGYEVDAVELGYDGRALDAMGLPMVRKLSGAVFMPDPDGDTLKVPIVVYTHGTELKRSMVATRGLTANGYEVSLGGAEGLIGAGFAAATPAIVLMPDFQGMGSDDDPKYYHPYVHRESLAWASVDMVKGFQERVATDKDFLPKGLSWNGKLYVIGYSEGGFAAMAFTREWQVQGGATAMGFPLDCSVPMAGPHNLSGRMVPVMTDGETPFAAPFFMPYVLYAYERIYPAILHPDEALRPEYVTRKLRDILSGRFGGGFANDFIWSIGGKPLAARKLLVETWAAEYLDKPDSVVVQTLAENNTVARQGTEGAWTNAMPLYLIHSKDDKLVPFGNSQDAKGWLSDGNGGPVSLRTVSPRGWQPDHGAAAPYALVGGMYWIANGCKE